MLQRIRKLSLLVCLLTVLTLLSGCMAEEVEASIQANCKRVMDAMIAKDPDAAYDVMKNAGTREEFDAFYMQVISYFDGVGSYELQQTGWETTVTNGETVYTVTFAAELSNGRTYILTCSERPGLEGLTGFFLEDSEQNLINNVPVWIRILLVVLSLAIMGFSVWMIVDCVKRKPDGKVLWIILMLCTVTLSLTVSDGFHLQYSVGLILSFWKIGVGENGMFIDIVFPVGAVVYFFLRKRLPNKKAAFEPGLYGGQAGVVTDPAPEESAEEPKE